MASCKKEEVIVPDNVPPPDHTIDSTTIDVYINKTYITILGREPIGNEKSDARQILKQNNFSADNRKQYLNNLFIGNDYYRTAYNIARTEYLRNIDSGDMVNQLNTFQLLLSQPQYAPYYAQINHEIDRIIDLRESYNDMVAGTIDQRGLYRRCINNYFYDQFNMGTENFVVSSFQNFFFRYPTDSELDEGKRMVDGFNAVIFLEIGNTKDDYLDIFFNSNDYYEGQVRYIFNKFLFREPSSSEVAFYGNIYKTSNNYKLLQKEILSTDEYAGIN
jgi:hypothetical protein